MNISRQTKDISSVLLLLALAALVVTSIVIENKGFWDFTIFFILSYFVLFIGLCFLTACIEYPRMRKLEKERIAKKNRLDSAYEQIQPGIRNYEKSHRPPRNNRNNLPVSRASAIVTYIRSENPDFKDRDVVKYYESLGGKENDIYFIVASQFHPKSAWNIMETNHLI